MAELFDITYDGAPVGTAKLEKHGLYYKFCCRCAMPDDGLYRIHILCGNEREDLGICIPMDDLFGMDKAVPVKRFGEQLLQFELVPKDWKPQEPIPEPQEALQEECIESPEAEEQQSPEPEQLFVPVLENEPFEYLDKLENAVLESRPDEVGILLEQ